tara:strand:+ start:501 stop:713 length:213 start_codon:yes stop_codon:yes gene_type:complete
MILNGSIPIFGTVLIVMIVIILKITNVALKKKGKPIIFKTTMLSFQQKNQYLIVLRKRTPTIFKNSFNDN